jgi:hypothetical protein
VIGLLLAGAGVGLGIALLVAALRPAPAPLSGLLGRLEATPLEARRRPGFAGAFDRLGGGLGVTLEGRGLLPRHTAQDLAVTGQSLDAFGIEILTAAALGAGGLFVIAVGASLVGVSAGLALSLLAALVGAVVGGVLAVANLGTRARARRAHLLTVLTSFLELVSLAQAGGAGLEEALEQASALSDDWAFVRLRNALAAARHEGLGPWDGLADLAEEVDLPELARMATTLRLAGTEGAKVRTTLATAATALRDRETTRAETRANRLSDQLYAPAILVFLAFMAFVLFPALAKVAGALR